MDTMVKQSHIDGHSAIDHSAANPLFRPWDCRQNQTQMTVSNAEKAELSEKNSKCPNSSKLSSSQSKMIYSSPEKPTKQFLKSTEALPFSNAAAAAAFAISHHRTPANILSLMSSTGHYQPAPCFPNGSKQFGPLPPPPLNPGANLNGSNLLKSASQRCQPMSLPPLVPDSMANFMAGSVPTSNGQLFSFPNLFAYNAFNAAAAAAAAATFHASGHHHHHHQHSHQQSHHHHLETLMTASNKVALQLSSGNPNVAELEKLAIEQHHHHQNGLLERTPKKQRPKRFQCPHCQVSFSNNGQLKGHIRIHTGRCQFVGSCWLIAIPKKASAN